MKRKEVVDDMSSSFSKSRRLDADLIGAMNEDQSSSCEVFQQRLPQERPLKRKDLGEVLDDLSSPSSKSRRLDTELFSKMKEDQISGFQPLACTGHMQKGALPMDSLPLPSGDEKAPVLYNPTKMLFYKTPASKDFSIIVNSDLIPGLRDQIFFTGGNLKSATAVLDGVVEKKRETSNDCWAVVPWVKSTWPLASGTETHAASLSEAQEVEMMDTDDNGYNGSKPSEFGAMMDGSVGLQQWQQQLLCMQPQLLCMQPQRLHNTGTPITW